LNLPSTTTGLCIGPSGVGLHQAVARYDDCARAFVDVVPGIHAGYHAFSNNRSLPLLNSLPHFRIDEELVQRHAPRRKTLLESSVLECPDRGDVGIDPVWKWVMSYDLA
jgi:hypothetical protein